MSDFLTEHDSYISSMQWMERMSREAVDPNNPFPTYGMIVSVDREKSTVKILTKLPTAEFADNYKNDHSFYDNWSKITAMVTHRSMGLCIDYPEGQDQHFVGDIEYPEIGEIVVYGWINGIRQDGVTAFVIGSIFPVAGCATKDALSSTMTELFNPSNSDDKLVSYRFRKNGYFEKLYANGKFHNGLMDLSDANNPYKVWERITYNDGVCEYMIYGNFNTYGNNNLIYYEKVSPDGSFIRKGISLLHLPSGRMKYKTETLADGGYSHTIYDFLERKQFEDIINQDGSSIRTVYNPANVSKGVIEQGTDGSFTVNGGKMKCSA